MSDFNNLKDTFNASGEKIKQRVQEATDVLQDRLVEVRADAGILKKKAKRVSAEVQTSYKEALKEIKNKSK